MTSAPRQMALLFTDVVDSTQLHQQIGDEAARRLWESHDQAARSLIRIWHGREVGRSDGFFILFDHCDQLLGFALAYHQALAQLVLPLQARIGGHWGPVVLRENRTEDVAAGAVPIEVDGLTLPIAARVMSAAQGGQTLLSAAAAQTLSPSAMDACRAQSHGHWRLKGLDEPIELIELGPADAAFVPPPDSGKAYRVVMHGGAWMTAAALPNNLGAEPDSFVGRQEALRALALSFDEGARLVSLLGIGGVGKTRLAQRYARGWLGSYPGGAWFCDLSPARGLDGVVHALAQALDVPLGRMDPVQQLRHAIAARGDCLLILDNFEQVARFAQPSLGVWLNTLPQARFLVTSREVLGLAGEHVQVLAPLSSDEAQSLYTQRMRAAGMAAPLAAPDAAALKPLVELLDLLPLAIELAAARARVVAPSEQVRRMGERFRLLTSRGGRHDRQATLRAALDWSWELLGTSEQSALAQLSVFEGGFTLAAAEAVLDLSTDVEGPWIADVLQSLVEKSLVRRLHERRFDLLRTVQDYAAERLPGLSPQATRRHWHHFATMKESEATANRCVETDNLVAACRRATSCAMADGDHSAKADAVMALANAWAVLRRVGPFQAAQELAVPLTEGEGLEPGHSAVLERVLGGVMGLLGDSVRARSHYARGLELAELANQHWLQSELLCMLAGQDMQCGDLQAAQSALNRALKLSEGDAKTRLMTLHALGNLALAQANPSQASVHFAKGLQLAIAQDDKRWQGGMHGSLGAVAITQGQQREARRHLEAALPLARDSGDRQWEGNAHCNLGLLLYEMTEHGSARAELEAALKLARELGHRRLEATTLCNLGLVLRESGELEQALQLFEHAVEVARGLQAPSLEAQLNGYLGEMLAQLGRREACHGALGTASELLKTRDDPSAHMLLACQRAMSAVLLGDRGVADSEFEIIQAQLLTFEPPTGSELWIALAKLRDAISPRC